MGRKFILNLRFFEKEKIEKFIFSLPAYIVCALLLAPFLFFCFYLNALSWPSDQNVMTVFFITAFQAGVSAGLSLLLAVGGSRGLLALSKWKYYFLIEGMVLLPCLIPPLLLVLSVVNLIDKVMIFPFGLMALIFTQTLTYTGLCTVALTRALLKQAPHLSEWVCLQTNSPWLFLKTLLKTVLFKDIITLFVLVFTASFTSLSLPLLTAGSSDFSLEFFIYEYLKDPQLWPQALSLILLQCVFIFCICLWAFSKSSFSDFHFSYKKIHLLPKITFAIVPFLALFLSLGGLMLISNVKALHELVPLGSFIFFAGWNSLILSLGAGGLTFVFFILMALSFQNTKARKFIIAFVPPGVSFMGFALLILPFYGKVAVLIKWIVGLGLLLFPWMYRFRGERILEGLSLQVEQARFMGAGRGMIFRQILWPQIRSTFFLCAGIVSFWACGDFAYSLIVSSGHWNLSLLVYDFFSSYRLDEAIWLSWLWIFLSFFVLMFWLGLGFVFDRL